MAVNRIFDVIISDERRRMTQVMMNRRSGNIMESIYVIYFLVCLWTALFRSSDGREYCQFESFNASCPRPGQLILMNEARYGRFQVGRCVTRDYGALGCSANILDTLDSFCTGKTSCDISVPTLRQVVQPCPQDLTAYLDADYQCINVDPSVTRCGTDIQLDPSSAATGASELGTLYVVGHLHATGLGLGHGLAAKSDPLTVYTRSCPLQVSVRPGQTINITLYSFSRGSATQHRQHFPATAAFSAAAAAPSRSATVADAGTTTAAAAAAAAGANVALPVGVRQQRFCAGHVFVTEGERSLGGPLCPGTQRDRHLYLSRGRHVTIYFTSQHPRSVSGSNQLPLSATGAGTVSTTATAGARRDAFFVLKLQATGCADVIDRPLPGAWTERYNDRLWVRCNRSHENWHLTCRDSKWVGTIGNCSESVIVARRSEHSPSKHQVKVHFGLTIAIAGGVVLGVFAGLTMLITVFYHRHHSSGRRSSRIERCRDRCPFDVKTASEWPLIGAKDVLGAGQVEDGCSDDMGLYGGHGAKSATAVFYDCSGQLRYSYSYQRCRPGELERFYDPLESSSLSSSTATTNPRRRTDEYELTELQKSMCYCSGTYKTHVGSVVPDSTTSGFILDGGLSGRRVLIDVHPTAVVAASAASDSADERSRLKAAASCSLNRRSLAGDETRRQLVAELQTSAYSPTTINFADTIYGRRTTFNQRPSALRLTTFRPRTPSIGTTSTSGTADDVVNDAVAVNYNEHNAACISAQTNFTSAAASNVSAVDDVAAQQQTQTSDAKEDLILEPAVNGSPEVTSKNVQQQDQHRYHHHHHHHHHLQQQQQSQYIDSVGGEYQQGALQPDVLPVVVTVTNQQTLGSLTQTSRLVSQLGRQSVDQLL